MWVSTCMLVCAYISVDKEGQANGMLTISPHVPYPTHAFPWPFTAIWLPFSRFLALLREVWPDCTGHVVLYIDSNNFQMMISTNTRISVCRSYWGHNASRNSHKYTSSLALWIKHIAYKEVQATPPKNSILLLSCVLVFGAFSTTNWSI